MAETSAEPYVFVSYASADRERVLPTVDRLEAAGVQTWVDREGIHGGASYALEIAEAIEHATAILLMCTPASLASRNVKQELALGWRFERPYVPLLLDPVEIPKDVAYWLEGCQWIELLDRPAPDWLADLAQALAPLGLTVQLPTAVPSAQRRARPLLVGREREQELLRRQLERMLLGQGGVVLVGGEAGIGKTTLVDDLDVRAEDEGALVLWGHAYDLSVTPPYGPLLEIFRRYQRVSEGLPPVPGFVENAEELARVGSQETLFAVMAEFFASVAAQGPLVLVFDDLQWADRASLDFFRFLARQVADKRLLLLATYRTEELTRHHPLTALLPLLVREAGAQRLDVRPLDEAGQLALIQHHYTLASQDETRLERYLEERAEGNPLYANELLRTLEEEGILLQPDGRWQLDGLDEAPVPELLRQVIERRVERLEEESQRLLSVAAVIGQTVPLDVWAKVGEVDEDAVLALAESAEEAHLLEGTLDVNDVRFSHALIREALYEGLPSLRRRRLHRQVGEALAAAASPDPDAVAYHFQQASDGRAAEWLIKAGERAQRSYDWTTAVDRYEAALGLVQSAGRDEAQQGWLSYRIARLGRYSTPRLSISYLDEALRIADRVGDATLAAASRFTRGLCSFLLGETATAVHEITEGVNVLEALPAGELERLDLGPDAQGVPIVSNLRGAMVILLAGGGFLHEAVAMGEASREGVPRHTPLGELGWAHYGERPLGLGLAYAWLGRPEAAHTSFARAQSMLQPLGNFGIVGAAAFLELVYVSFPFFTERLEEHRRLAQLVTDSWEHTSWAAYHNPASASVSLLRLTGEWSQARAEAQRLWKGRERAWAMLGEVSGGILADLAFHQGEPEVSWSVVRAMLPEGPATGPGTRALQPALGAIRLAASLCLAAGDLPQARLWLGAHDRWLEFSGAVLGRAEGTLLRAEYHHASGDAPLAHRQAEEALTSASDPRQPLALIAAHRFLGQLDTEARAFDAAEEHLQESLKLADACRAPFERALTLLELARLRAVQGQSDEARAVLDEARAICEPLGAKPALERVFDLRRQLGDEIPGVH